MYFYRELNEIRIHNEVLQKEYHTLKRQVDKRNLINTPLGKKAMYIQNKFGRTITTASATATSNSYSNQNTIR